MQGKKKNTNFFSPFTYIYIYQNLLHTYVHTILLHIFIRLHIQKPLSNPDSKIVRSFDKTAKELANIQNNSIWFNHDPTRLKQKPIWFNHHMTRLEQKKSDLTINFQLDQKYDYTKTFLIWSKQSDSTQFFWLDQKSNSTKFSDSTKNPIRLNKLDLMKTIFLYLIRTHLNELTWAVYRKF